MSHYTIQKILDEEISHLQKVKDLLKDGENNELATFFQHYYFKNRILSINPDILRQAIKEVNLECPFVNRSTSNLNEFLLLPGQVSEGFKEISKYLSNSEHLSIIDPYFFNPPSATINQEYLKNIIETFIRRGRRQIDVYCLPGPKAANKLKFERECKKNDIGFKCYISDKIHDRVIIVDNQKGLVIGTSFGGFGNKYCFILPLPSEDLERFKNELYKLRNSSQC